MRTFLHTTILLLISAMAVTAQNVGIGTPSPDPSAMLEVSSNNKGLLIPRLNSAQRLSIPTPASGLLVFDSDSSEFYFYDGSGWTQLISAVAIDSTGAGNGLSMDAKDVHLGGSLQHNTTVSTGNNELVFDLNGSGDFRISDNGNEAFRVADNGSVGISVANPSAANKLEVAGTVQVDGFRMAPGATDGWVFTSDVAGNATWLPPYSTNDSSTASNGLNLIGNDIQMGGTLNSNTNIDLQSSNLTFDMSGNGDFAVTDNGNEAFRVSDNGSVGIGTASPSATNKLEVAGTVQVNAFKMSTGAAAGWVFTADAGGNATWLPPYSTNDSTTASNGLNLSGKEVRLGGTLGSATNIDLSTNNMTYNMNSTGDFIVSDNGSEAFRVSDNGSVGIGTASPSAANKLEVNGKIKTTQFAMSSGAGVDKVLSSDADGNASWIDPANMFSDTLYQLGIRIDSPSTALDVNGGVTFEGEGFHATISSPSYNLITVGDRSFIRLTSNSNASGRLISLTDGLAIGQILFLDYQDTGANGVRFDNSAGAAGTSCNCRTQSTADMDDNDTMLFIWDGNNWLQVSRSTN